MAVPDTMAVHEATEADKLLNTIDNMLERLLFVDSKLGATLERALGPQPSATPILEQDKEGSAWVHHMTYRIQRIDEVITNIESSVFSIQRFV